MHTARKASATSVWKAIANRVSTPQGYACLIAAQRVSEDPAARAQEYRRLRDAQTFAELDQLHLSAGQVADLAIVVSGGAGGVNANRLDGAVRTSLAAHGLMTVVPGCRWPPADWRATVRATLPGVAVVRAAQGRPVQLNTSEATPLAVIERAMRVSPERGEKQWPGSALALRVAQTWRLVAVVRVPPRPGVEHWSGRLGAAVYRLTPDGVDALERHRQSADPGRLRAPGVLAAQVLERVSTASRGDIGVYDATTAREVQRCVEAGWLAYGPVITGTDRQALRLTDSGRDALAGWRFRQETRPAAAKDDPTLPVTQVEEGMLVRVANRRAFPDAGDEWVRLVEKKYEIRDTAQRLSHNYELWVTSADRPEPYLYGGRAMFRTVRLHVRLP